MNLHSVVRSAVRAVNPDTLATVQLSTGAQDNDDATTTPLYTEVYPVVVQVQPLSSGDLALIENTEQQGIQRVVYMNGNVEGIDRPAGLGGDKLTFWGAVWLVTQQLEVWDLQGWCKVVVTKQMDQPA